MEYSIEVIKVNKDSKLDVYLAPGGGFAIEIIKN